MVVHDRNYQKGKPRGRPKIISKKQTTRIKRFIRREAGAGHLVTSRKIKESLDIAASRPTIRRKVNEMGFSFEKIEKCLPLTSQHCLARMNFAEKHLTEKTDFNEVVFSDEKRFSLDGPDNMGSYVEKRNDLIIGPRRIKRPMGGGGVLVIGAICSRGTIKVKVIDGKYTAAKYLQDLRDTFLPWIRSEYPHKKWIWQQDNATIHTARIINQYFLEENIMKLDWPARSPDLNIIENVWHLLEQDIYQDKQYNSRQELIQAITTSAMQISANVVKNLYNSIPSRLVKVMKSNGRSIDY